MTTPDSDIISTDNAKAIARIGPFRLVEFIGEGGMGQVWRARHAETRLEVALKVITEQRARRAKYHAIFQREAQSIAALDHPGIVRLYDYGRISEDTERLTGGDFAAGSPYLAMEFCQDRGLDEADDLADWARARTIVLSLLDALAHAHARGVIHRDIKPGNVLLRPASASWTGVKLADFGLAVLMDPNEDHERRGSTQGTPAYMPPEQCRGRSRDIGPWTDLYSVGLMAWELVSGRRAFDGRSFVEILNQQLNDPLPALEPRFAVPEQLESWIRRMTTKQPRRRFRTAAEAAWGLRQLGAPVARDAGGHDVTDTADTDETPLETLLQVPDEEDWLVEGDSPEPPRTGAAMTPARPPMPRDWQTRSERPGDRVMEPTLGLLGMRRIPIVDREELRQGLWDELAACASEGTLRVTCLRGATGYGKRTLARWLAERAHETGQATVLNLDAGRGGETAVEDGLHQLFRTRGLELEAAWERIHGLLAEMGATDLALSDQAAQLLTGAEDADFNADRRAAVAARTLAAVATERPLVLCLENLQASADLVDFLNRATRIAEFADAPILCVCTVQDDELADDEDLADSLGDILERTNGATREVGLLPDEDMRQLTAHMLRLSADVSERVISYADGNPLFAVELVRDWADRGLLEWTPNGFVLADTDEALIPEASIDLWNTRLDAALEPLDEAQRHAVQAAALLGLSIAQDVWVHLCERIGVEIPDAVVSPLNHRRLTERTQNGWRFAHAMVRHALADRASKDGALEMLHATCAQTLETLRPRNQSEIGQHWYRAGRYDRALQPMLDAADRARHAGRHDRGIHLISVLETILDKLSLPEDAKEVLHVAHLRGMFRLTLSRTDGLEDELRQAISVAENTEHHSMEHALRIRLMNLYQLTGRFDEAQETAAALLAEEDLEPFHELVTSTTVAKVLSRTGSAHEALEITEQLKKSSWYKDIRLSLRREVDALEAYCMFRLNRLEEAEALLAEAADALEAIGSPANASIARLARVNALMQLGRLDEAEAQCRAVLKKMQAFSVREVQNAELHLAYVLLYKEHLDDAAELLNRQLGPIRREGRVFVETFLLCGLAYVAAKRADWTEFAKRFDQLKSAAAESECVDLDLARFMQMSADAAINAGERELATRALEFAASQLDALGFDDELEQVREDLERISNE